MNWRDFRYSLRMILKTPGASAIAIVSLALGIGANTAIFSIIDTLLLKRLPVKSPQELYRDGEVRPLLSRESSRCLGVAANWSSAISQPCNDSRSNLRLDGLDLLGSE